MAAQQAPERELSGDDTAHCPCDKSRARRVARRAARGSGGVAVPAAAAAGSARPRASARPAMVNELSSNFVPGFVILSCLVSTAGRYTIMYKYVAAASSAAAAWLRARCSQLLRRTAVLARSTSRGTTGQVAQGCTCRPWCCCAAFARGPSAPARLHATRARRARQRRLRSQRRRTRRPSGISSGSWKRCAARSASFEQTGRRSQSAS